MANLVCEVLITEAQLKALEDEFDPAAGAVVVFWGVVREVEDGRKMAGIDYEAHMASRGGGHGEVSVKEGRGSSSDRFRAHWRALIISPSHCAASRGRFRGEQMDCGRAKERRANLETAAIQGRQSAPCLAERGGYTEMNWANRLTLSRLLLTVLFVLALNSSWQYARTSALIIFLIAGLTDFIDGEIARRYGVITNFGKLMDPLVDKIMMAAAFISLVPLKAVPAWAATTVVARDFLITGLRLMASAKGRILPAESLGKQKTSWQIITVIFFLALLSMPELRYANETSTWWVRARYEAGPVLVWITVALTVYSGLGFTWRNRELIAPDQ